MYWMNRETLIAYSFYFGGEYGKIFKAVKEKMPIPPLNMEGAVTILDEAYPKCFLDLKYPPLVFYYCGDLELLKKDKIAIVGSRNPCNYALEATKALARSHPNEAIVSGLAKGIDASAHENALQTIGILGCGIDYIYPYCNKKLIQNVKTHGLVISEYPGMTKPYGYHFPFRNRLIVALSKRVYIMQSAQRSGTMTTVNEALELGREIRVLPYDIFCKEGIHNNVLISEGAMPILNEEIAI